VAAALTIGPASARCRYLSWPGRTQKPTLSPGRPGRAPPHPWRWR